MIAIGCMEASSFKFVNLISYLNSARSHANWPFGWNIYPSQRLLTAPLHLPDLFRGVAPVLERGSEALIVCVAEKIRKCHLIGPWAVGGLGAELANRCTRANRRSCKMGGSALIGSAGQWLAIWFFFFFRRAEKEEIGEPHYDGRTPRGSAEDGRTGTGFGPFYV